MSNYLYINLLRNLEVQNYKKKPIKLKNGVSIKLKFSSPTHAEVLQAIPNMNWIDGYTVQYNAKDMVEAYALIRLMYKYVKP